MKHQPRHAITRAVTSLSPRTRAAIVAATAAVAATAGGLAVAGPSGAATAGYTVSGHNISMGQQFAGLCLDDYKQDTSAGAPVVIWACSSTDPAQQWYPAPDGTIRLDSMNGPALDVNSNGKVVMGSNTDANAQWFPLGDWGLVNMGLSSPAAKNGGPSLQVVNDPGYSKTQGTQLIVYPRTFTTNAQFNIPGTSYAQTAITDRPDGSHGPIGSYWAADSMTRYSSVTALGSNNYVGNVADENGSFLTYVGNSVPNQGQDPGKTIGDSMTGSLAGTYGFTFTASQAPNATPPASAQGVEPTGTSDWFKLFFPSSTNFTGGGMNSGPMGYSWQYSGTDNCGTTETWVDAASNGDGNVSGDGDITAPASSSC